MYDLLITCSEADIAKNVISSLGQRFCEISVHSALIHNYLEAVFDFSTAGSVKISMPHHTTVSFRISHVAVEVAHVVFNPTIPIKR